MPNDDDHSQPDFQGVGVDQGRQYEELLSGVTDLAGAQRIVAHLTRDLAVSDRDGLLDQTANTTLAPLFLLAAREGRGIDSTVEPLRRVMNGGNLEPEVASLAELGENDASHMLGSAFSALDEPIEPTETVVRGGISGATATYRWAPQLGSAGERMAFRAAHTGHALRVVMSAMSPEMAREVTESLASRTPDGPGELPLGTLSGREEPTDPFDSSVQWNPPGVAGAIKDARFDEFSTTLDDLAGEDEPALPLPDVVLGRSTPQVDTAAPEFGRPYDVDSNAALPPPDDLGDVAGGTDSPDSGIGI